MKKLVIVVAALILPCLALADVSVSEKAQEPADNLVSIEVGMLLNSWSGSFFGGEGVKYARSIADGIFFKSDALAFEGGMYYYQVVNLETQRDAYTAYPVSATLQYGRAFGETFRPYVYGGVLKTFGYSQNAEPGTDGFFGFQPVVGGGVSVTYKGLTLRADIGTDLVGTGIAYAF